MNSHYRFGIVILSAACFSLAHLPAMAEDTQASMPCPHAMPMASADADKLIDIMRDNLKKMDAQLDKVRNAKDTAARDKALREYALTQGENMRLSHGIGNPPMMMPSIIERGGMGQHMMMGGGAACDPDARIHSLEKRMELMQKQLDQLKKKPASAK